MSLQELLSFITEALETIETWFICSLSGAVGDNQEHAPYYKYNMPTRRSHL
jgi:hypothetical protein